MDTSLSNVDIALYALYRLGGITKKIHTEEIAWESYQLSKERFCWRLPKFRQMDLPDKTPVRYALEQAKKKENGQLILGRAGGDAGGELEGWIFTPQGVNWVKKNEKRISNGLKQKSSELPKRESERFIKRIKSDPFFQYFKQRNSLEESSQYMFTDMLVCAPDASKSIVKQKFEQLCSNAELINDREILNFLKSCRERFQDLIS